MTARQIEAAYRTTPAKGEVGIVEKKEPAPTLKDFADRFKESIKVRSAEKPQTIRFYLSKLESSWIFPGEGKTAGGAFLSTSRDGQRSRIGTVLGLPKDFVLHSLRHYVPDAVRRSRAGCFHDHADSWTQYYHNLSGVCSSFIRSDGASF